MAIPRTPWGSGIWYGCMHSLHLHRAGTPNMQGFYKWAYTPTFRGFESYLGYFDGVEDYYTHKMDGMYDLIEMNEIECGDGCYQVDVADNGRYSTFAFAERAIKIIENHSNSTSDDPLFLYLPWQSVHAPWYGDDELFQSILQRHLL